MADRLLNITEAAAMLNRPEATLRFWRHQGTGPRSFRLGRRVVYREREITDWVDEQAREQGAA